MNSRVVMNNPLSHMSNHLSRQSNVHINTFAVFFLKSWPGKPGYMSMVEDKDLKQCL